jgi:hypothetical protein
MILRPAKYIWRRTRIFAPQKLWASFLHIVLC